MFKGLGALIRFPVYIKLKTQTPQLQCKFSMGSLRLDIAMEKTFWLLEVKSFNSFLEELWAETLE